MSTATTLIQKCEELRAGWDALAGGEDNEQLQQLDQSLARFMHVLCELRLGTQGSQGSSSGSSTQAAPAQKDVMNAVCDLLQHMRAAAAELGRMEQLGADVADAMATLASLVQQQQLDLGKLQEEVDGCKFLAKYRAHISQFRVLLARRVSVAYPEISNTWDQLAFFLQQEQEQPPCEREVTREAELQLQDMGFTWSEWQQLHEVADAAISAMYTGKLGSIDADLAQLDVQVMPQGLQHTQATVKKAMLYIRTARVVPKRACGEVSCLPAATGRACEQRALL
uniref:Uncharacterized protein n=1 Tax=Chlamydomonas leiostraca TaxID=1034604 RepID=A0A7S0X1D5_9CHLO|mmetsp:Transcript_7867/g.19640  ORF Transcript_7867/g.19640 Transcript_7867/m.19640 type:complete len:282 (+) Transcript_7867:114-959(+)